jgi:hypothetical protein
MYCAAANKHAAQPMFYQPLFLAICLVAAQASYFTDLHERLADQDIRMAVQAHHTPVLFDWLVEVLSYQGVSDAIAWGYMDQHGRVCFSDLEQALRAPPSCPRLTSYWHFHECRFAKTAGACAEPAHIGTCPLPIHDLRNGRLNRTAYSLFLFLRDACGGDLVGWIDQRLAAADQPGAPDRAARMRQALLEPLRCIHGVSHKVLSMALADPLLGADPNRERWVTTGASMVAVDTLVHNWLHRTGILRRLEAEHAYGPACYGPGGCASIIEQAAQHIDAREFCPDGPAFFPRLVQKAVWLFCAESGLGICNGNRIDDRDRCAQHACPLFATCERVPLRPRADEPTGRATVN